MAEAIPGVTMVGGYGPGTILGGAGDDLMIGGTRADAFVLRGELGSIDEIRGFSPGASREGDHLMVKAAWLRDALIASASGNAGYTMMSAGDITVELIGVDAGIVCTEWFLIG